MAVGGIAINLASIEMVERKIRELNAAMNITSEIKWSNVKPRRDKGHWAYVDLLRTLVGSGHVHFHIRFQETQNWDHKRAGPRRKTDTVSRAFYQLLLHRPAKFYGKQCDIYVRADAGDCTEDLHKYIGPLNIEAKKLRECGAGCIRSIEVRDSKKTPALQLLDVTLGGLAALRNARHLRPEISDTKKALALYLHEQYDKLDLAKNSSKAARKFCIWNAQPKK